MAIQDKKKREFSYMKNLKIAFCWEWERAKEIEPNWRDGLRAALELIGKKHTVDWYLGEEPKGDYDWIITWCDSNTKYSRFFFNHPAKRGIFLTTHPSNHHNLQGFDVVFCESEPIYDEVRMYGIHAVKAFGTDDAFFCPDGRETDIPYFYPATFSPWKRQQDIAHLKENLTCIGTIQPDGMDEYNSCLQSGVNVKVGYFPPDVILDYYRRSESVVIPAVHGSERTVLESMSCGILPEVTNPQNIRAKSYINECVESGLSPREFIQKYYSAKVYAKNILKGLKDEDFSDNSMF